MVNVTAVNPSTSGYITVYPCGSGRPATSNVNDQARATTSNGALVKTGTNGTICVYTSAATDLVIDTTGYVRTT